MGSIYSQRKELNARFLFNNKKNIENLFTNQKYLDSFNEINKIIVIV